VEAQATVAVQSKVDGQLLRLGFREGEEVARDQLLFELDGRLYQAELRLAEAALARDRAQLATARAELERFEALKRRQFVAVELLEQRRTAVAMQEANVAAAAAAADAARIRLEDTRIRSPLAGRTGRLLVHAGNQVKADSTGPLVVIHQIDPIAVAFAIPEAHLPALQERLLRGPAAVEAMLEDGRPEPVWGELRFVDNAADPATATITLKASFGNAARRLWPGRFAPVRVVLGEPQRALVIPSRALQIGPDGPYVFVVKSGERVEKRPVAIDRGLREDTLVAGGLAAGERVVVDGQSRLVDGAWVAAAP
jgi:multidrug efflux system membrane fusion protein